MELFQAAVARQTDIMVMNILGHGVDIPLLGLREACKELNNGELCELFTDESYAISQCFLLSTSQVILSHPPIFVLYFQSAFNRLIYVKTNPIMCRLHVHRTVLWAMDQ